MIQFKVKTTRYSVKSPERQLEIETHCAKIKRNTGRTSHKAERWANYNPQYPKCYGGESTAQYVRTYERLNDFRFVGKQFGKEHPTGKSQNLFGELSDNPQWPQTDSVIEEPLND